MGRLTGLQAYSLRNGEAINAAGVETAKPQKPRNGRSHRNGVAKTRNSEARNGVSHRNPETGVATKRALPIKTFLTPSC